MKPLEQRKKIKNMKSYIIKFEAEGIEDKSLDFQTTNDQNQDSLKDAARYYINDLIENSLKKENIPYNIISIEQIDLD